jgi:hypothetical protein
MIDPEFAEPGAGPESDALDTVDLNPDEQDLEAPEADALEQRILVDPTVATRQLQPSRSLEVNDWDALEQAHVVDFDEDY